MLKHFGFKPPRLIQNVRTQVRDLDFDRPPCLDSSVTMDRAWQLMRNQKISAIPVTNEDGTLYGMLSAGDIATFSLNTIANPVVEEVPMFNLLSVIEGRIVGEGGDLVVFEPVVGQVYGYGQKDYRSSRSMVCYAKWDGSGFVRCDKLGRELKA